jgi:murein DD-endopeptidase MepM/ murein hydrolase activator NlpD
MGVFDLAPSARPPTPDEASRALEALLLKHLLKASGAFEGRGEAGSSLRAGLFAEALAQAVADGAPRLVPTLFPPPPASDAVNPAQVLAGPARVTSGFGERPSPFTGLPELHPGVDLAAPFGTAILAAADGVVRFAGERGGHGLAVEIDHGAGETTLYGHASELLVAGLFVGVGDDRLRRVRYRAEVG